MTKGKKLEGPPQKTESPKTPKQQQQQTPKSSSPSKKENKNGIAADTKKVYKKPAKGGDKSTSTSSYSVKAVVLVSILVVIVSVGAYVLLSNWQDGGVDVSELSISGIIERGKRMMRNVFGEDEKKEIDDEPHQTSQSDDDEDNEEDENNDDQIGQTDKKIDVVAEEEELDSAKIESDKTEVPETEEHDYVPGTDEAKSEIEGVSEIVTRTEFSSESKPDNERETDIVDKEKISAEIPTDQIEELHKQEEGETHYEASTETKADPELSESEALARDWEAIDKIGDIKAAEYFKLVGDTGRPNYQETIARNEELHNYYKEVDDSESQLEKMAEINEESKRKTDTFPEEDIRSEETLDTVTDLTKNDEIKPKSDEEVREFETASQKEIGKEKIPDVQENEIKQNGNLFEEKHDGDYDETKSEKEILMEAETMEGVQLEPEEQQSQQQKDKYVLGNDRDNDEGVYVGEEDSDIVIRKDDLEEVDQAEGQGEEVEVMGQSESQTEKSVHDEKEQNKEEFDSKVEKIDKEVDKKDHEEGEELGQKTEEFGKEIEELNRDAEKLRQEFQEPVEITEELSEELDLEIPEEQEDEAVAHKINENEETDQENQSYHEKIKQDDREEEVKQEGEAYEEEVKQDDEANEEEVKQDDEANKEEVKQDDEANEEEVKQDDEAIEEEVKQDDEANKEEVKEDDEANEEEVKQDDEANEEEVKQDDEANEEEVKQDDEANEEEVKQDDEANEEEVKQDDEANEEEVKQDDEVNEEEVKQDDEANEEEVKQDDEANEEEVKQDGETSKKVGQVIEETEEKKGEGEKIEREIDEKIEKALKEMDQKISENPREAVNFYHTKLLKSPKDTLLSLAKARAVMAVAQGENLKEVIGDALDSYFTALSQPPISQKLSYILVTECVSTLLKTEGEDDNKLMRETLFSLLEMYPDSVQDFNDMAFSFLQQGLIQPAKIAFDLVLERDPYNSFARLYLGSLLKINERAYSTAVYLMLPVLEEGQVNVQDPRIYLELGDALRRLGRDEEAKHIYAKAVDEGLLTSPWQHSIHNVRGLINRVWWTKEQLSERNQGLFSELENYWSHILQETKAIIEDDSVLSEHILLPAEDEDAVESGGYKRILLFAYGRKNTKTCDYFSATCRMIENIPDVVTCQHCQAQILIIEPSTRYSNFISPTNSRLRADLGLSTASNDLLLVRGERRAWQPGRLIFYDPSFDREWVMDYVEGQGEVESSEVNHKLGLSLKDDRRAVLSVDFWHPDLTDEQKNGLESL